jgi:2-keto-4-pentenoate hydratase
VEPRVIDPAARERVADELAAAERDRAPIDPLPPRYPGIDVADAYRVALRNVERRIAAGARVVGHKVGLSSPVMQQMMGVDRPDYGHLLDDMAFDETRPIALDRFCRPRVEVEIAFGLADALPGAGCTEADVLAAVAWVAPALEIIDSRIRDWRIGIVDTIADNASSAGFVLGAARVSPARLDLRTIEAVLRRDGVELGRGRSDAVLGNPLTAVAWLARTVAEFGVELRAGHVVLPGSCTRAVDLVPGASYRADFAGLGSVALTCV